MRVVETGAPRKAEQDLLKTEMRISRWIMVDLIKMIEKTRTYGT